GSASSSTSAEDTAASLNNLPGSPLSGSSALAGVTPSACRSSSIANPFDVEPEQLTQPSCSPSMFLSRSRQTPGSRRSFRWSIEQMAGLWPANIEEEQEPSLLQPARSDALYEEQSQQAIELFFSRHEIVPSPWEAPSKTKSVSAASKGLGCGDPSLMKQCPLMSSVLGDYFKFHAAQDKQTTSQVNHSRDSLRRKLFCNTVEAKMHTPERHESERLSLLMDGSSRRLSSTSVHMALCSSPIGGGRRHTTPPLLGSPQQQQNMKLSDPGESPPFTDEDDHTDESVATSGGAGDMSVVTAADRSDCMQLSPCASGQRQAEPL
ncbi:hypothetical protein MRX96_025726, partial [Rhipicephalus microplus]